MPERFRDAIRTLTESGDGKYSIQELADGRRVAVVDDDFLSELDVSTWNAEKKAQAKVEAEKALLAYSDGYVFYDVVNMEPTKFSVKKETSTTAAGNNTTSDIQEVSFGDSISTSAENVNTKYFLKKEQEQQATAESKAIMAKKFPKQPYGAFLNRGGMARTVRIAPLRIVWGRKGCFKAGIHEELMRSF